MQDCVVVVQLVERGIRVILNDITSTRVFTNKLFPVLNLSLVGSFGSMSVFSCDDRNGCRMEPI